MTLVLIPVLLIAVIMAVETTRAVWHGSDNGARSRDVRTPARTSRTRGAGPRLWTERG